MSAGEVRQRILRAAFREVVDRGIDKFTVDRVAARADVDHDTITAIWHDRRVLLMDALLSSSQSIIPLPDTGGLRGDVALAVQSAIDLASTQDGRRQFVLMMPRGKNFDPTEVQRDFRSKRLIARAAVFRRAAERGELREGIDPLAATEMLAAAISFDVLFADSPIRPDFVEQVLDIFLRGISR